MTKHCNFCGNIHFKNVLSSYVHRDRDSFFVVENVPSEQCNFCGEKYYLAADLKKIENLSRNFSEKRKIPAHVISVPVEEFSEL